MKKAISQAVNQDGKYSITCFLLKNRVLASKIFVFLLFGHLELFCPRSKIQVLFSRMDNVTGELIKRISCAEKSIYAAVYLFTDVKIAQALVEAKGRGVDVQIALDMITFESHCGQSGRLIEAGIKVFCIKQQFLRLIAGELDASEFPIAGFSVRQPLRGRKFDFAPSMHNKFAVFDENVFWTGSFNWTEKANLKNDENVIVVRNIQMADQYKKAFEWILGSCVKVDLEKYKAILQAKMAKVTEKRFTSEGSRAIDRGGRWPRQFPKP